MACFLLPSAVTGTGSTGNTGEGNESEATLVPPNVGELGSSGKGVLGCSLAMVLSALLLSILSLLY